MIRVLEFFKNRDYEIVTDNNNNSFFKNFNKKNILTYSKFKNQKMINQNIINLVIGHKIENSIFDINNYLRKKINKVSTYELFKKLNKFKKKVKIKKLNKKKYKVGINKIVPQNWKIKS